MSQLIDNLNIIESVKTDIKTALENKGVDMTGVSFPGYASKIGEITTSFVTVPLSVTENGTYTPNEGIDGYSQVVVDVPQSVTGFTEKEITEGINIVNLSNSASYVHPFVFEKNNYLQTVNLPNCISVGENAFAYCSNLTTVNLPKCESIKSSAFINCSNLTTVNLSECMSIKSSVFTECTKLQSIYLPKCQYIGNNVFYRCLSLNSISLPLCSYIGNYAFQFCSNLSQLTLCTETYTIPSYRNLFNYTSFNKGIGSIYVDAGLYDIFISSTGWSSFSSLFVSVGTIDPMLSFSDGLLYGKTKNIHSDWESYTGVTSSLLTKVSLSECNILNFNTFSDCINLSEVYLPKVTYIGSNAFYNCQSLHQVSLPVCSHIGNTAFYIYPTVSLSLTLGYNGVCKTDGQLFDATHLSYISVFVPASLVDAYKSADVWNWYSDRIFPIPE